MMTALILASGMGSRLEERTKGMPKALLEVGGVPLLQRSLQILSNHGVDHFVITTGYARRVMEDFVGRVLPKQQTTFVFNEEFATTNYIYSMWLALPFIKGNAFLLHADLFFDDEVFGLLAGTEAEDAVIVKTDIDLPEKDFKARIKDGQVERIGVDLMGPDCSACLPMYKLSQRVMGDWGREIASFVKRGDVNRYAEDALNLIMPKLGITPVDARGYFCMELDTTQDLAVIEKYSAAQTG